MRSVGELIESVYLRFGQAPLSYGHGTDNAWDEAVYLVLSVTGYADDEASLQQAVTPADFHRIEELTNQRIHARVPVSYTHLTLPTNREV